MNKKKLIIITGLSIFLILIGTLALLNFSKFPISSKTTLTAYSSESQKFIAHRGFSSVYPENTIPAIKGAIDKGFYGCEFDIHTTKDGVWVLNHDSDIDKMSDGTGEISEMTYDELLKFNIDHGNGIKNYPDLKFPTLDEALTEISKSDVVPFIEIKGYDPVAFELLLNTIEKYSLSEKAVIISFDMEALIGIREISKDIKLMFLTNILTKEDADICLKNGNIGVNINFGNILKMKDALKYAQEKGLETAAWTVDMPIAADLMNAFGIKHITTNRIVP